MTNYTRLENIFLVANLNNDQHVALERATYYFESPSIATALE